MTAERQHRFDVFREGDEIPWRGGAATITHREVMDEYPVDTYPDSDEYGAPKSYDPPNQYGAKVVVLTIEYGDGDGEPTQVRMSASVLGRELSVRFEQHGLPSVAADAVTGIGEGQGLVKVQTPATGTNTLSRTEAERLAAHLREHREFEPLYGLLGGTNSPEDMDELAAALDRSVSVCDASEMIDEYESGE